MRPNGSRRGYIAGSSPELRMKAWAGRRGCVAIPSCNSFPGARGNFSVRGLLEYRRESFRRRTEGESNPNPVFSPESRPAARLRYQQNRIRPGRDLNPGQKLRRLLGYPLPYRDTRTDPFTLTTRVVLVKKDCSPGQRERTCGFLERGLDPTDYTPPTRTWISTVTSFPENSSR